jgi:hypothetical protein
VTALDRRLQKVEDGLSPTEAVVRWLEEAKSVGSYAGSVAAIKEHRLPDPYTSLPRIVAAWVDGPLRIATTVPSLSERSARYVQRS